jgi:hypothetical protein
MSYMRVSLRSCVQRGVARTDGQHTAIWRNASDSRCRWRVCTKTAQHIFHVVLLLRRGAVKRIPVDGDLDFNGLDETGVVHVHCTVNAVTHLTEKPVEESHDSVYGVIL